MSSPVWCVANVVANNGKHRACVMGQARVVFLPPLTVPSLPFAASFYALGDVDGVDWPDSRLGLFAVAAPSCIQMQQHIAARLLAKLYD